MRFDDIDNDLVKVANTVTAAGGEIILIKGRILSKEGGPLVEHRIEIWQCDMTDDKGWYQFRTIKPTNYPGRAPHVHVKVWDGKRELLTTQFYLAEYKFNDSDGLYRRLSAEQADRVSMVFSDHDNVLETQVDVII